MFGVKISHNATVRYATTMGNAWNVNFWGFMTKMLANLEKMMAEIL
jgi:hypothetical protein